MESKGMGVLAIDTAYAEKVKNLEKACVEKAKEFGESSHHKEFRRLSQVLEFSLNFEVI